MKDEIYPNQPLVEVVFQIRFPGELAVECQRHFFWESIRHKYPHIHVPKAVPDKAISLTPYRFEKEDESAGVLVALNSLAFFTRKYPGYKLFKEEFMELYKIFGEHFSITKLTRAGWRYINIIPFAREEGLIPLDRFLTLGFDVPESIHKNFNNLSLNFTSKTNGGSITTKLETLVRSDGEGEAFLLDFDYSKEHDLHFNDVEDYIEEAHQFSNALFEDFITDNYREYLRGKTL